MIFTQQQIEEIKRIIDYHSTFLIATNIGVDVLTKEDTKLLNSFGTQVKELYTEFPPALKSFFFGRLSAQLSNYQAGQVTYDDFLKYLKQGQYVPLSPIEENEFNIAKRSSYKNIKTLSNRMQDDLEGIILEEDNNRRVDYQKVFKREVKKAVIDRKALTNIVSEMGEQTGNWNRDWGRLVDTEMNNIFQRGRSQTILKRSGEEAKVFKDVYSGACRHCIRLYLTSGIGSQPKLFTLEELTNNGSNIGRKVKDWKATLDGIHPFCRCNLREQQPGKTEWNEETQSFKYPKKEKEKEKKTERPKVKVQVGDKIFMV